MPVPLILSRVGLGPEARNVCSVVGLGFSLHVTHTSHCVDALIGVSDVAKMLVNFKGHLKAIVCQEESISSLHTSLFSSVCHLFSVL